MHTDGRQTTEGSSSRTSQTGGGSFLLLPRRHAVSSRWPCTFNHNTCANLNEIQGAATRSLFPPPLCQDMWPRIQLLCVERNVCASELWPLTKPNLQRLQRNDRAMIIQTCNVKPQDIVTIKSSELLAQLGIEDLDLIPTDRMLR